jgi:hypothetical protein
MTLEMIKWEHSIFALPFALTAAVLAASGWPHVYQLFWIIVCMVLTRSVGMAFNRWANAELDARIFGPGCVRRDARDWPAEHRMGAVLRALPWLDRSILCFRGEHLQERHLHTKIYGVDEHSRSMPPSRACTRPAQGALKA